MPKLYRFEICAKTPAGGTGKTLEVRFTDSPIEAQNAAKQAAQEGKVVPAIERWSDMNEDYVISISQTELALGRKISDYTPKDF